SQFFVVTGETAALTPDYAVLGLVVSGMETVDRISAQAIDPASTQGGGQPDGAPAKPIVIQKITVARVS
ncbi:MAG: peptidylprolyl isomerase, partial [Actinomycetes bacterium]